MSNTKKTIKVRDLKPNKDAKGGGHFSSRVATSSAAASSTGASARKVNVGHGAR